MKKTLALLLITFSLLSLAVIHVTQAAPPAQNATPTPPSISFFVAGVSTVDRAALTARSARVPVSWSVSNRPTTANLVFEQILTDNSAVNVELPRAISWVASSGNGVAAPVPPGGNASSITLRLRLVNQIDHSTLDNRELTLPIGDAPLRYIRTFFVGATEVNRADLTNRRVRIAVTWAVDNRPDNTNLVFEQVLPGNSTVNVELPRSNPYVASAGDGVTAPIPPGGTADRIILRLRLVNLTTNVTLDQRDVALPIVDGPLAKILSFSANATLVSASALNSRIARVPVSWSMGYRPENTNLVFEQVLSDNSIVNVELPRTIAWVPSEGIGVAAPVPPGGNATSIKLRVRLVNLADSSTLDTKELTLPIGDAPAAAIRTFTTSFISVNTSELMNRTARVPVSWVVDNRPDNSNLVFEQVMPDGASINVELPRSNPYVASEGNGMASPALPATGNSITLRLRLVNLANNTTLDQREIILPIAERTTTGSFFEVITDKSKCFGGGFEPDNGIKVGERGRVTPQVVGGALTLVDVADVFGTPKVVGTLNGGDTFVVTDGPYCYHALYTSYSSQLFFRMWKVRAEGKPLEGWATEYLWSLNGTVYNFQPFRAGSAAEIVSFTVDPTTVKAGDRIKVTWVVKNAISVTLRAALTGPNSADVVLGSQPLNGTAEITVPNTVIPGTAASIFLDAYQLPEGPATVSKEVKLTVACQTGFFWGNGSDCASSTPVATNAAFEPFQTGMMIWRGDTKQIYVLSNTSQGAVYPDTWAGGTITYGETPAAGLVLPQNGFGWLWTKNSGVRAMLGWGTAAEQGYNAQAQEGADSATPSITVTYVSLPDGRVVRIANQGAQITWQFIAK